jgi:hypothetical protein
VTCPAATEAAGPPPTVPPVDVWQGYAQVLQGCLGRQRQTPFDLAGLQLYRDMEALAASLQRCLDQQEDPTLRQWSRALQGLLPRYQAVFADVAEAQTWVAAIGAVLDVALPTEQAPGPGSDAVARQVAQLLGVLADRTDLSPWLQTVREQLSQLSERYWRGLFVCYDVRGVPRTNNDLEGLFGATRRRARQQSGYKQVRRPIARQGAWLLYTPDADVSALERRLAGVPREIYQEERAAFEQRQERFRQRLRWKRHRTEVLEQLEAQWAS